MSEYPAKLTTGYYRVRQTWEDEASQLGAYKLLANAKTKCDENPGYFVFTNDGTAIYPENETIQEVAAIQESATIQENATKQEEVTGQKNTPDADTPGVEETAETVPAVDTPAAGTAPEEKLPEGPTEEAHTEGDFPDAVEYKNDGGEQVIAYARLKTLMNIRAGNALDAELITTYRKNTIVEVLQECDNGWLRIKCPESRTSFAYVSNEEGQYAFVGRSLYTVAARDNLWKIAEKQLGNGTRYTEIRQLNGLTCNIIRVGMPLILPEK